MTECIIQIRGVLVGDALAGICIELLPLGFKVSGGRRLGFENLGAEGSRVTKLS